GISFYQDYRSRNAISALKKFSAPRANVLRDGKKIQVNTEELVVNDILLLEEGELVGADGTILEANDLSINESMLTGESLPVNKITADHGSVYKGSLVLSGSASIQVTAVGNKTMFG